MNKEEYDKYYQKGGTYEIPVEIFNNLLDELDTSNNKLKEVKEYCEVNIDDKFDVFLSNELRKIQSIIGGNNE